MESVRARPSRTVVYNLIAQEKSFRYALINQGFDIKDIPLTNDVPDDIQHPDHCRAPHGPEPGRTGPHQPLYSAWWKHDHHG